MSETITFTHLPPEDKFHGIRPLLCPHCGRQHNTWYYKLFKPRIIWTCGSRDCKRWWFARPFDARVHSVWIFLFHDFSFDLKREKGKYVMDEYGRFINDGPPKPREPYVWAVETDKREAEFVLNEYCTYDEKTDRWMMRGVNNGAYITVIEKTARGKILSGKPKFKGDNLGWLAKYRL